MKKTLLFVVFLFLCLTVYAQNDEEKERQGFALQISAIAGFSDFDLGELNEVLSKKGFPAVKNGLQFTPSFSISSSFSGKNVLNVTVGANSSSEKENGRNLEQEIRYGEFGFDRYLMQGERSSLYIGFAFGAVWYDVIINSNVEAGTFSEALDDYQGMVRIRAKNNQYLALKAGYDWAFDKSRNFLIGARTGYRIGLGKEKWEINNKAFPDSPETSGKGFFFGIALSISH